MPVCPCLPQANFQTDDHHSAHNSRKRSVAALPHFAASQTMRSPNSFVFKSPIPVYAVSLPHSDVLLYTGGGGQSRSGVANAIVRGHRLAREDARVLADIDTRVSHLTA